MEIIGHRGAMGLEPENTLRSIKKALSIGVDRIEFDVYVIRSGEVVLMHDDTVDRTTNGKGFVRKYSFKKLRKLEAGLGEKIPTLQEALDIIDHKIPVNIELKGPDTAGPVAKIIDEYINNRGWKKSDFIVSSFKHDELRKFHELLPGIKITALLNYWAWLKLFKSPRRAVGLAKNIDASGINPNIGFVNEALIEQAHKAGLSVNVYTINDEAEVKRMAEMGVDAIFCNYPDRAKEVLQR